MVLSEGPAAAAAAYAFLQSAPRLAVLHDTNDPSLQAGGEAVVLLQAMPWNQAPSITTMVLPEVGVMRMGLSCITCDCF
jgi:hypothetical protein